MKTTSKLVMKKLRCLLGTPVALGLVIVATGCAGDQYNRSTGESIDDRATTTRVKSALSDDARFKYPGVQVTTFKGMVQLSGFVDSGDQKSKAAEIAKTVPGVKDVENNITIKQ